MEVLVALVFVVFSKAITANRMTKLESEIRSAQQEETDVSDSLQSTETALRQLEKEQGALEQEIKHLENDKDLACLEVTKLGGNPLTEEQLEQLLDASKARAEAAEAKPTEPDRTDEKTEPTEQDDAPQEDQEPGEQDVSNTDGAEPTPKNRYRILVVDDNNELRGLLQQALEAEYDVLEAPDGYDALTKIVKEKQIYDLVITDLKMPNVNGITLVEHLPDHIPTIVISAFVNNPEFKEALEKAKPADVLQKPFQMSKLREAIKKALSA